MGELGDFIIVGGALIIICYRYVTERTGGLIIDGEGL